MENNKKQYHTSYNKAHYVGNKEKRDSQSKEWYEANKAKKSAYNKEYSKKWREKNKTYNQEWCEKNKEKKQAYNKAYREANKLKSKEWREANKEKINNWFKTRKQIDPLFKLKEYTKISICQAFNRKGYTKRSSTAQILGCSFEELKLHLESQFEPWMNWENRGGNVVTQPDTTWDVDHIIPLDSAETEADIIRLNHYTNLRPLCSYQNRFVKRNKVE